MSIRVATLDDADGIAHVHVASWRSTYANIIDDDFLAALDESKRAERWQRILSNDEATNINFVAELDGKIVGFAGGGKRRGDDAALAPYSSELYAIYLLEDAQGYGLGRALTQAVATTLHKQNFDSMCVWVLKDNPSLGFYTAMGGTYVIEKTIMVGEQALVEAAYGWADIEPLVINEDTSL